MPISEHKPCCIE